MPDYEPIIDDSLVLTREMIDRLMRAYTGTFTTTAYPVEDMSQEWCEFWETFTSDDTDGQEQGPGPEPCTETELTDFLGI